MKSINQSENSSKEIDDKNLFINNKNQKEPFDLSSYNYSFYFPLLNNEGSLLYNSNNKKTNKSINNNTTNTITGKKEIVSAKSHIKENSNQQIKNQRNLKSDCDNSRVEVEKKIFCYSYLDLGDKKGAINTNENDGGSNIKDMRTEEKKNINGINQIDSEMNKGYSKAKVVIKSPGGSKREDADELERVEIDQLETRDDMSQEKELNFDKNLLNNNDLTLNNNFAREEEKMSSNMEIGKENARYEMLVKDECSKDSSSEEKEDNLAEYELDLKFMNQSEYEGILGIIKMKRIYKDQLYHRKGYKYKSDFQVKVLNDILKITPYPNADVLDAIGVLLNLKPRSVQIWFQNARQGGETQMSRDELKEIRRTATIDTKQIFDIYMKNREEQE